jgi:hypothetical protein
MRLANINKQATTAAIALRENKQGTGKLALPAKTLMEVNSPASALIFLSPMSLLQWHQRPPFSSSFRLPHLLSW